MSAGTPRGYWRDVASRLWRERAARIAAAVLAVYVLAAVAAPLIAPFNPLTTSLLDRLQPPSRAHWLGQDEVGRDILSRIIFGARVSLSVAMLAALLSVTVGTAYGLIAGYLGGRIDSAMMRVLDAFLAIPRVLLLIALLALFSSLSLPRVQPAATLREDGGPPEEAVALAVPAAGPDL